jgi:hypothetical protein
MDCIGVQASMNIGTLAVLLAHKWAPGVWEEKKSVFGESPPIEYTDAFASPPHDHIHGAGLCPPKKGKGL